MYAWVICKLNSAIKFDNIKLIIPKPSLPCMFRNDNNLNCKLIVNIYKTVNQYF